MSIVFNHLHALLLDRIDYLSFSTKQDHIAYKIIPARFLNESMLIFITKELIKEVEIFNFTVQERVMGADKLPIIVQHLPKTRVVYSRNCYFAMTIFLECVEFSDFTTQK